MSLPAVLKTIGLILSLKGGKDQAQPIYTEPKYSNLGNMVQPRERRAWNSGANSYQSGGTIGDLVQPNTIRMLNRDSNTYTNAPVQGTGEQARSTAMNINRIGDILSLLRGLRSNKQNQPPYQIQLNRRR